MKLAVIVLLTIASGGASLAQTRPDFTGTWTLIPQSASRSDAGFAPQGPKVVIAQDGQTIKLTVTANFSDAQVTSSFKLDGSPTKRTLNLGAEKQETVARTKWDGQTLVITTEWPLHKNIETLKLDTNGRLIASREANVLAKQDAKLVVKTNGPYVRTYQRTSK